VRDVPCTNEKEMVYVIDDDGAGDGGVRLRNEETNQCLYVYIPPSNPWGDWEGFLYNWGCWSDPAMTFILNPQLAWLDQAHSYVLSGFVLDHLATGYCPGSSFAAGGEIPASQCYLFADPGRVFSVDIIGYPSVDLGPGILPPPSRYTLARRRVPLGRPSRADQATSTLLATAFLPALVLSEHYLYHMKLKRVEPELGQVNPYLRELLKG
jgi:hypothetical protein